MLGSALYYPTIDIHDPQWLRSALLFWDDIHTIAPSSIKQPYENLDTRICAEQGFIKPIHCDLDSDLLSELGRRVLKGLSREKQKMFDRMLPGTSNQRARNYSSQHMLDPDFDQLLDLIDMHPAKFPQELRPLVAEIGVAAMNSKKLSPKLKRAMRRLGTVSMHRSKLDHIFDSELFEESLDEYYLERHRDPDAEWILVNGQFASAYMASMATMFSQKLSLSPLTSLEGSFADASQGMFLDDVEDRYREGVEGAFVSLIMRAINVDASTPIDRILKFKRQRRDQYLDFAAAMTKLTDRLQTGLIEKNSHFEKELQRLYGQEIHPHLRSLKRELGNQNISATWDGAFKALTLSVPSGVAVNYFTDLTGLSLIGVGAAITATDVTVRSHLSARKARAGNPYSYLHDVQSNFGLPSFDD